MHPRFVLCFFFAVSANPLVACEGFETRSNTETIIDFGELNFVMSPNGSFDQEEDIEFFDTLNDCEKKLLLAGYARENCNKDAFSFFLEKNLALGMAYIGKMKEESTTPIPTNHYLWMDNDSFSEMVAAAISPYSSSPIKRIYQTKRNIIVKIKHTDWLVDPKEIVLYNSSKELLLYGFLSTGSKTFYIPEDILQMLISFLHDEEMLDKIKENERVENMLKRYIERASNELAHASKCGKELRNNDREYLENFGCISCFFVFNLAGIVVSGIMLSEEERSVGFWSFFLSIFSLGTICSLVWLRCLLRE